jgi:hypothetical protein
MFIPQPLPYRSSPACLALLVCSLLLSGTAAAQTPPNPAPAGVLGTLEVRQRVYQPESCFHNGTTAVCSFVFVNKGPAGTLNAFANGDLRTLQFVDDGHVPHNNNSIYFVDRFGQHQPQLLMLTGDTGQITVEFPGVDPRVASGALAIGQQIIGGVPLQQQAAIGQPAPGSAPGGAPAAVAGSPPTTAPATAGSATVAGPASAPAPATNSQMPLSLTVLLGAAAAAPATAPPTAPTVPPGVQPVVMAAQAAMPQANLQANLQAAIAAAQQACRAPNGNSSQCKSARQAVVAQNQAIAAERQAAARRNAGLH